MHKYPRLHLPTVRRQQKILKIEKDPAVQNLGLFEKKSMSLWPYNNNILYKKGSIRRPCKYCQFDNVGGRKYEFPMRHPGTTHSSFLEEANPANRAGIGPSKTPVTECHEESISGPLPSIFHIAMQTLQ